VIPKFSYFRLYLSALLRAVPAVSTLTQLTTLIRCSVIHTSQPTLHQIYPNSGDWQTCRLHVRGAERDDSRRLFTSGTACFLRMFFGKHMVSIHRKCLSRGGLRLAKAMIPHIFYSQGPITYVNCGNHEGGFLSCARAKTEVGRALCVCAAYRGSACLCFTNVTCVI
jgi:hypothetical protein